jgi:hypothetical protein
LVEGFNRVRRNNVVPGRELVVDECMSAYRGLNGKYMKHGNPSEIKIARKPEGVGTEFKSLADGQSGVLLRLDPREELPVQRAKKYEHLGSSTGAPLRLVEDFFFSSRSLTGDSAFSSLQLVDQLRRNGLFYNGIVKQCSKKYPKSAFIAWGETIAKKGDHIHYSTDLPNGGGKVFATAWQDKRTKMIISNCSQLGEGEPVIKKRHRLINTNGITRTEMYEKTVRRPLQVEHLFKYFSVIDVHDHYRQGSLRLEKAWVTKKWWHRIVCTILGMSVTDAFLAYRYEYHGDAYNNSKELDFTDFLHILVQKMVFNRFLQTSLAGFRSTRGEVQDTSIDQVIIYLLSLIILFLNNYDFISARWYLTYQGQTRMWRVRKTETPIPS